MKKYLCYLLFICPIVLQAQLLTKWNIALSNQVAPPEGVSEVLPLNILSDQDKTIYLSSVLSGFAGWQLSALDATNGKVFWKSTRNFKSPKLDSVQYFPSNLTTDENGNLVQLGIRMFAKYPISVLPQGSIAKGVYDKKTGKELSYIDHFDEIARYFYLLGNGSSYTKSNDGKSYYLLQNGGNKDYRIFLRRIDAKTFSKVDTLHNVASLSPSSIFTSKLFQFGNNKLSYLLYTVDPNKSDSTSRKIEYVQMDSTGKETKKRMDISPYFYYYNGLYGIKQLNDGILIIGTTDTTKLILQGNESKKVGYVIKIDSSGKLLWRLFHPSNYFNTANKDPQVIDNEMYSIKGDEKTPYGKKELLVVDVINGKVKNLGEFRIKNETRPYSFCVASMTLPNKDYIFGYQYEDCATKIVADDVTCFGLALISYEDIKKITATKEEKIFGDNINVYPNPVSNSLQIQLPEAIGFEYNIYDIGGKPLKTENVTPTNLYEVDTANFPKGIYFLNLKTSEGLFFTKKIVKM